MVRFTRNPLTGKFQPPAAVRARVRRNRARKGRLAGRRAALARKVSPGLRAAIRAVVGKDDETKYIAETLLDDINFNSGIGSTNPLLPTDMYRCIPLLYQTNTGSSYGREGKQVEPIACKLHLKIGFDRRDANQRDVRVVVYMLRAKTNPVYSDVGARQPGFPTTFLDDGLGNNVRFLGKYLDVIKPIDKEGFSLIHKRVFTLHKGQGELNDNTSGDGQGPYFNKELTLNVPMPKHLLYEDGGAAQPTAYAPVFAIGYYYPDNTAPDLDTTSGVIQVDARCEMWYKDN